MNKKYLAAIIFLLIGAMVLAACGGGGEQGGDDAAVMEESSDDAMMDDEHPEDEMMEEDDMGDEEMMDDEHPEDEMMEDEEMMDDEHPDDEMMEDEEMMDDEHPEEESMMESPDYPDLVQGGVDFHASNPADVQLASGEVQFVEFFAYWCSVCKQMAPTVHGLEQVYGDKVNFVYLDRDDPATNDLRNALGYVYQPHYFLLDAEGNVLGNWTGVVAGETFQAAIETALQ
jgi:thiol-disulfide isomerase/thioredoxin